MDVKKLYRKYKDRALCIDIEVTGSRGSISILGCFKPADGEIDYHAFVRGEDLTKENLLKVFKGIKLLITYNGNSLDIPSIKKEFPGVLPDVPVFDVFTLMQINGIQTSLKVLENTFGISRLGKEKVMAAKLWKRYVKGDKKALEKLIEYNRQDTINLYPLCEEIVKRNV